MKLKEAVEFAKACDLETLHEAVYNIEIHAMNTFEYSKIGEELDELWAEYNEFGDMPIEVFETVNRQNKRT